LLLFKISNLFDTVAGYRSKLKIMNVSDELPAVLTDVPFMPSFYQLLIHDNRLVNMAPYIKKDKEWLDAIEPEVLEAITEEDGSIYVSTIGTNEFSSTGIFWNKELFEKAGISKFPQNWSEFWDACELLKEHGITPLGLHTKGTAWAPMLLATANLGTKESGVDFMKKKLPVSFNNPEGKQFASILKKLFHYANENAIGTDFDQAYEDFFDGKVAMLPNGFWMIQQIDKTWQNKVGFSLFPNNISISSPDMSGWSIANSSDDNVIKGALAFMKFRALDAQKTKESNFQSENSSQDPISEQYFTELKGNPQIIPNYQIQWSSVTQEAIEKGLPDLIEENISIEEFIKRMDENTEQYTE